MDASTSGDVGGLLRFSALARVVVGSFGSSDFEKETYPPWIVNKMLELDEHPELEEATPTKITDFLRVYIEVWVISNKSYQEEYWGKQGQWGDNFGETMETFRMDCEAVLDTDDIIEMTLKQREMITELLRIGASYSWGRAAVT